MRKLLLVRHGQASSILKGTYDKLSETGAEQCRLLAGYFLRFGTPIDRVVVGPLRRHIESWEAFRAVYRDAETALPEAEPLGLLNEHHGIKVLRRAIPLLAQADPEARAALETLQSGEAKSNRAIMPLFRLAMTRWAAGDLNHADLDTSDIESWPHFRRRAAMALEALLPTSPASPTSPTNSAAYDRQSETVVAFTSGGLVAGAVGHVVQLGDVETMKMSWAVRNSSFTELHVSGGKLALTRFNAFPHIPDRVLETFI